MCSNCPPITIGKESGNKIIWYMANCLLWSCPECRPIREAMWIEQMTMNWSGLSTVFFDVIESDAWEAYRKKLVRRGGKYAKIIGLDGTFYVFTDVQVGTSVSLSVDKAIEKFGWCIKSANAPSCREDGHVISTSRLWKLLKPVKLFNDFERIAVGVEKKEVERVLDELGQTHTTKPLNDRVQSDAMVSILDSGETYRAFKAKMLTAKRVRTPRPISTMYESSCREPNSDTTKKERGNAKGRMGEGEQQRRRSPVETA